MDPIASRTTLYTSTGGHKSSLAANFTRIINLELTTMVLGPYGRCWGVQPLRRSCLQL